MTVDLNALREALAHVEEHGFGDEVDYDSIIEDAAKTLLSTDLDYGNEFVVEMANGNTIRTDTYEQNPAGSSYVRVCAPDGREFVYWSVDEWEQEPQAVMGALLAAAGNPPDNLLGEEV